MRTSANEESGTMAENNPLTPIVLDIGELALFSVHVEEV